MATYHVENMDQPLWHVYCIVPCFISRLVMVRCGVVPVYLILFSSKRYIIQLQYLDL
jgi:hypothetical protein